MTQLPRDGAGNVQRPFPQTESAKDLAHLILQGVTDFAIFTLDPEGRITSWNSGAERIKGYREEEVLGKHVSILYTPEDRASDKTGHLLRSATATGRAEDEGWRVRKDGSRYWASVVISAIHDENGRLLGFADFTRDVTDRKRAEEALRRSEERFRIAQELSHDAFTILKSKRNEQGEIVDFVWEYANQAAGTILRRRPDELIGRRLLEVLHGNLVSAFFDRYRQVVETGASLDDEVRYQGEGISGWFRNMVVKLGDGVAVTFQDITIRKHVEEERERLLAENRRQREWFERIVANAPIGVAILRGPEHRYVLANSVYRAYASERGPIEGRTFAEVWPDVSQTLTPHLDDVFRTGQRYQRIDAPIAVRRADARTTVYYSFAISPLHDANGNIESLLVIVLDATREVESRKQLDAERRWLRTVIERSPAGIILVEGVAPPRILANRRAEELFGTPLPPEGGLDQYVGLVFHADGRPMSRSELVGQRVLQGEVIVGKEEIVRRPDGKQLTVLVSAAPILDPDQTVVGAVIVFEDITELKEAERQREEWASIIAHDLRAPITVISGFAQILARTMEQGGRPGPEQLHRVQAIRTNAQRLNRMVSDLLDVSRIEARRLELNREQVDLNTLVQSTVAELRPLLSPHPVQVQLSSPAPVVSADPQRNWAGPDESPHERGEVLAARCPNPRRHRRGRLARVRERRRPRTGDPPGCAAPAFSSLHAPASGSGGEER